MLSGFGQPDAFLSVLRDGQTIATLRISKSGIFDISVGGLGGGIYTFGLFAEDIEDRITETISIPQVAVFANAVTRIANIIMPSTLELAADTVFRDGEIVLRGSAFPGAAVVIFFPPSDIVQRAPVDTKGQWELMLDASLFSPGDYTLNAYVQSSSGLISKLTKSFPFSILAPDATPPTLLPPQVPPSGVPPDGGPSLPPPSPLPPEATPPPPELPLPGHRDS